jgi:hypothetical protein
MSHGRENLVNLLFGRAVTAALDSTTGEADAPPPRLQLPETSFSWVKLCYPPPDTPGDHTTLRAEILQLPQEFCTDQLNFNFR